MNTTYKTLVIDPDKIDFTSALILLETYQELSKVLLDINILERLFILTQGNTDKLKKLREIVQNALLYCTITQENPTADSYNPDNGQIILGPPIYNQQYIDHICMILPSLENINTRILEILNKTEVTR